MCFMCRPAYNGEPFVHKKRGKDTNYFDIFAAIGEKKSEFSLFSLVLKFFVIPV